MSLYASSSIEGSNERFEERICWICYGTFEENPTLEWRTPCLCSGSTKWVHEKCLARWIDEKQAGNQSILVSCPQCKFVYRIVYPKSSVFFRCGQTIEDFIRSVCPLFFVTVCALSIYWTMCTFGAVTVLQVMGVDNGIIALKSTPPIITLLTLPAITIMLIFSQCVNWDEGIENFIGGFQRHRPIARNTANVEASDEPSAASDAQGNGDEQRPVAEAPSELNEERADEEPLQNLHTGESVSVSRIFCGALFLPTIATFIGNMVYHSVHDPLKRALLGGATFTLARSIFSFLLKRARMDALLHRRVLNLNEI